MKVSSLPVCATCLLTVMFSEIAIAQRHLQCNYTTDIDQDNDGLIEICDLNALNAIRYQLDGSGYRESLTSPKITAGCPRSGCNGFELHRDLDFNADDDYRNITNKEAWTSGLGWLPISDRLNFFAARFEGNGHAIVNLYINRPSDYVGLFKATAKRAKISNLVLSRIDIKGNSYVGSLAGHNAGSVAYIGVEGGSLSGMGNNVGGLFGANIGTILNGDVILERIEGSGHSLGGLVGYNEGRIMHSVADASLSGVSQVGGLVGLNSDGALANNRTDGTAKGRDYIGGLVGLNRARISSNHAEGRVISEGSYSGGLVGANHQGGRIADSQASGTVSGNLYAGGLVGWNKDSEITNSFTVNRVDGNSDVGGLVGSNEDGQISNTYASGSVGGVHRVGGLVGSNKGIVSDSFVNGQVVASGEHVGGLIGWNYAHQRRGATTVRVVHSYWDSEAIEILLSAGGSPRTTAQLKSPTAPGLLGETFERWNVVDWEFGTSEQYPILRHSEGSNRRYLLPGQHIMLSGLLVLDGLTLSPAFNPQTFNYRVTLSDNSVSEIRFSPTIANSTQTISVLKDKETSLPSVHNGETVLINLNVAPKPTLVTIARHYQIWVLRQSGLQATISSNRSDHRVSEGQDITFNASTSEPEPWRVRHWWSQVSPAQPNLLEGSDLSLPKINIDIPDDFVAQDENETPVVLRLEVNAGGATVVQTTTMTVVKANNGGLDTLAIPIYREGTLTVADISEADLSMEPDAGVDLNSFRYQWQYKLLSDSVVWQDIEGAMRMRYEIPMDLSTIDNISYRVRLNYRDNQGHRHRIVSEPLSIRHVAQKNDFADIYYLEDLNAIRNQLDGKYELVRDLDFQSDASYRDSINKAEWTVADYDDASDTGWVPIGNEAQPFAGSFDGNGYTISGLQINRDTAETQGLFGVTTPSAVIRDIGLLNLKIEGGAKVAGLVGTNRGQIGYSYVIGSIESKRGSIAGGLVASNDDGDIIGSYAISEVFGASSLGGLVGDNGGTIINSRADTIIMPHSRGTSFGGLVGHNRSLISNSYATGEILASGSSVIGGLVGRNALNAQIINGYASVGIDGSVTGGLAGFNLGSIKNSYAIGKLKSRGGTEGSLVGVNAVDRIINSYWNTDNIATGSDNGIGQNTIQLRSGTSQSSDASKAYYKWRDSDWYFGDIDQYPMLKHTTATNSVFECGSSGLPQCGDLISPGFRYGLRSLTPADDAIFSVPIDIEKLNQGDVYFGTVISDRPNVRLIPVAMESTARISIIGTMLETIESGDTSSPISLKNDQAKKVVIEVEGTQTVRYMLYLSYSYHRVIDEDNDGLVDINYLEDLDAIRHQLDGSGYRANVEEIKITFGCPSEGCKGYELLRNLDFNDLESYRNAEQNMHRWTGAGAWQPIAGTFTGTFQGNNKTIANLRVRGNGGLFVAIGSDSRAVYIDGIGLSGVDIKGDIVAGIATSCKQCTISNSYVIGNVEGTTATAGLLNDITTTSGRVARISNSYFIGNLVANGQSAVGGGLIGDIDSDTIISNSYVVGTITAQHDDGFIGGMVGVRSSSTLDIVNSYASVLSTKAGVPQSLFGGNKDPNDKLAPTARAVYLDEDISRVGVTLGESRRTVELQKPTSATGIYMRWRSDNLGNSDNWDFGTDRQYPAIKYNLQANSTDGDTHCGAADMQKRPAACQTLLRHQGSLLQDLQLSEGAGLSSPFSFALFDYGLSVNTDQSTIRILPTAFNAVTMIEVFSDGNLAGVSDSGEWTMPIPLNDSGDTVVALVVKDGKRRSYPYQFTVNRLNIVAQNIDKDGDGLIDIGNPTQLDAIRRRLDGSAYQHSETTGAIYCPNGCIGYELTADIDLAGMDWQPIASFGEPFSGVFKGNGHTISNLTIKVSNATGIGLFGAIGGSGRVENVGLVNVNITANNNVGSIAGYNFGTIINSYATGKLVAMGDYVGGLVGRNRSSIIVNSYANVDVRSNGILVGGLVGFAEVNSSIVNSYVSGDVQAESGGAGGLVGSNDRGTKIHNSYAFGDIRTNSGLAGGLTASADLIVNSYYRAGAVISGTDSLLATDKTAMELKAGVPSDDIYTEWNRADWHFGNDEQYPALLYAESDDNNTTCRQPSPEQLSRCNSGLFAGLSEHDKPVVCRSHLPKLPEQGPYCGALLSGQRADLVRLEFSENARLIPAFNPQIYDYDLVIDADTAFVATPTAYDGTNTIIVNADGLSSPISSGQSLSFTLSDDLDSIVFEVQAATPGSPTLYTIRVHGLTVVDDLIMIDYLEDLNLMHYPLTQLSATLEDCPIGIDTDLLALVSLCKGYKLIRDLDFKDPESYRVGRVNPTWTTGAGWQPVGKRSNPFNGLFNGNAHTIANLRIHGVATDDSGLFGAVADGARIENIGLLSVDVDVDNSAQGIFGVGALVGRNNGDVVNSYVIGGSVRGHSNVGGLVGRNERAVVNSYAHNAVTGSSRVGGLVGYLIGRGIYNSYATGAVSGNNSVGGLLGEVVGRGIFNSYATGAVSGDNSVGGLVGQDNSTTIVDSYTSSKISGSSGGLIGSSSRDTFTVDASYWDVDTSKVMDDGNNANGIGKTTTELQTSEIEEDGIYIGWDRDDWYSGTSSQYPLLQYTKAIGVINPPACRETKDADGELPVCGTLLPAQHRTGLSNLARSSEVLLLRPDFDSRIYDYELIVKSNEQVFTIIPRTFNPNARIVLNDDSETNPREELGDNEETTLMIDNSNGFLLTLTVGNPSVSATTQTTLYSIKVSKHPFITANDIDEDDDGLIEIRSADDLSAIRYQLDGSGYKASGSDTKITIGCPTTPTVGCKGYELAASIDLSGSDWNPIGAIDAMTDATTLDCNDISSRCFAALFDGNRALGYEISGLRVASQRDNVGLFAALADSARVRNVNLSDVEIAGSNGVGSLAAYNAGEIDNSYANGTVAGEHVIGGLVAYNSGRISNSYAYGMVSGDRTVGGLVARNQSGGVIANSYSLNRVSGNNNIGGLVALNLGSIVNTYASGGVEGVTLIGGLVGENGGSVRDSYATADITCTGVPECTSYTVATGGLIGSNTNGGIAVNSYWDIAASNIQGSAGGVGKTTVQLQSGTSQSSDASRAYYEWNDSDWNFGNANQYPILKYAGIITRRGTPQSQSYGLESLAIVEVVMLSPNFSTTKLHYRIGVELDADIRQLHLTPDALDKRATIRIVSDNGFDETVKSGTSSSEIVLRSTATTVITVEVSGDRRVRYHLEVNYYSSSSERDIDTDKDGLIDILTLEDLDAMRNALDGSRLRHQNNDGVLIESVKGCPITGCRGYELLRNLDFDNPTHYQAGSVNSAWITGEGWQPVGTQRYPFTARFKGNGYTISNLRVNRPDSDGGLFGVIDGRDANAIIEGLGLSDVSIVGGVHVGGLVGRNWAGDISQSYVTGYVAAHGNGTSAIVGGLVGHNRAGDISESYVTGFVSASGNGTSAIVGGLVGHNRASDISKSYVTGSVSALGNATSLIVGGLVGRNIRGFITESYSETQVKGNVSDRLKVLTGGLVALNNDRSHIENSYTIGSVIAQDSVGGLVASNRGSSEIINSYAVSRVIAIGVRSRAGGLVAVNSAMVGDSYWDIEASGVTSSAGGTSATTAILQSSTPTSPVNSIYRNWDPNVWEFADADRYPALKAVNNARLLARRGKSLLQSLTLSGNVRLFPHFHPLIFDYDIIAESRQMTEVQLNTTSTQAGTMLDVVCNDGLICASSVPVSFVLDGSHAPQITISTRTPDDKVLPYNFSVRYVTSEIKLVTATTTTTSMPLTVAEGERVRLMTLYNFGLNEDSYRYSWRQSVGDVLKFNDTLSPVDTQSAVLDFMVPINVVSRQDDSRVVELILEIALNDEVYLSKTIPLIISKRDNDVAHRVRLLEDNIEVHTYSIRIERKDGSEFIDRDGDFAAIDIQWQRRRSEAESWINLVSAPAYALPNEGDYQYRARVVYEDNQGYREQLESEVINYLDIDDDNDGLIEIRYLEELDAIRYVLDGSGYKADAMSATNTTGCPVVNNVEKCRGYELMNDLDFTDDASYRTADPVARSLLRDNWTVMRFTNPDDSSPVDSSWQPIGGVFNTVFNGNGHTISNMQINYSVGTKDNIGLFSEIGETGKIENLGLVDPAIKGLVGIKNVGGIAGAIQSGSVIVNSYVVGDVAAGNTNKIIRGDVGFNIDSDVGFIGGMVGRNKGLIFNSYTKINVVAEDSGTLSNKLIGVGGLAGRNIDGGKVYNSYATGEVKGPCTVGGLVGNQSSSDPGELLKTSQIKNSYTTGNVETGFGTCSESNNQVAGGLVGVNNNSTIENGYILGEILGDGTLAGLVGGGSAAINSYWNYNSNCRFIFTLTTGVGCFGTSENFKNSRTRNNFRLPIAANTELASCPESFITEAKPEDVCDTYVDWNVADWNFGTSSQFPALKYGIGPDTDDPGCDTDTETALPSCDALLPGQIADALLLNGLSLSVNSQNVQLTPDFMSNRFNYEVMIEPEIVPVAIKITADADEGTAITIRKDGGTVKQLDGSVQISAKDSFNIEIKTASGNNRGANYQIQVRLKYPLQPKISKAVNGSTPTEVIRANILTLDEGDVVRLDASASFGQNNPQLDYQWSQVSGKPLSLQIQSTSTLGFMVPVDFVARDEDDSTVILKLELSESGNPASVVSREIPLLVRKVNNGNSESAAKWISSYTLSASDLSDDIDGKPLTNIGYQWSREQSGVFVAIPNANQKSYTPPEDARNAQYRLSISYTDAQGYDTTIHYDAPLYTTIANFVDKDGDGLIEIETLEDLFAIRYQPDGSGYRASAVASKITTGCPNDRCNGYELTRSLDFMDDNSYRIPSFKARYTVTTTTDLGWEPIGSPSFLPFQATFNGNGYTISNLMINRPNIDNVGLFGYTRNSQITNLGLLDVDIRGQSRVGSLVGWNDGGTITSSYAMGTVLGTGFSVGGLVGWNDGGTIASSYAMGSVSGASNRVGGLVGNNDEGTITNSHAMGTVSGTGSNIGGLVGWNDDGTVMSSYATGDVTGNSQVGGLVGENRGDIMKSYATGVVVSQDNNAGGLVGINDNMITNSYATGDVSGLASTSNLAGHNDGTITNSYAIGNVLRRGFGLTFFNAGEINDSYWLSGSAPRRGLQVREDAEKTAEELKLPLRPGTISTDVYYNWSADIWDFGIFEEYPALKYHDDTCDTSTPFPDCGKLLLHQRIGLRDLRLEQNIGAGHLHLSPAFSSTITTYTVSVHADASELKITPIAANPDAIIVADGKVLPADNTGYTIALNTFETTSTVISVAASNSVAMEQPVVYKLTINSNRLPRISINAPASIAEGETLELSVAIEDLEGDEFSYSLTTIPDLFPYLKGSTGTIVGHADLIYELNMPSDLLGEMQIMDVMDIVMTVDDGSGVVSEAMQLTIVKHNNGVTSVPAPMLDGFTYTINIDLSSDSDGINPNPEIAYQWQEDFFGSWFDVDGATDASYTVEGIIGDRYRVLVDYTDKQSYRHQRLASPAVAAPQQFVYDIEKSRGVVRTIMDSSTVIFVNVRVLLEGLLR